MHLRRGVRQDNRKQQTMIFYTGDLKMYFGTRTRRAAWKQLTAALILYGIAMIAEGGIAQAALLDGLMNDIEESLAEHIAKKDERLITGNFYTAEKPNAHGPIGMMGEHTHEKGEIMFSYRYKHMFMQETRNGTNTITNAQARALGPTGAFMAVPTSMRMEMHMFGIMYGVNDTLTVTVMAPYIRNSMDHEAGTPLGKVKFTTRSEGIGDIRLGSLWRLWAVEAPSIGAHRFHFNFAVSFPSGDIEPTDFTPAGGPNTRLPYPMHLGSGTVDFFPGITYGGEMGRGSWGFQTIATIRAGTNGNGFSKGDAYSATVFGAYEIIPTWLSGSVRFDYNRWQDYDGADPAIATIVQTAIPTRLGGERLDLLVGLNLLFPEFMGIENRLAIEGGMPIYQWLQGQLETDSIVTFGWQGIY